ncbi:MAG: hypothetical protein P8X39_11255, partial [Desulfofustis sp.]
GSALYVLEATEKTPLPPLGRFNTARYPSSPAMKAVCVQPSPGLFSVQAALSREIFRWTAVSILTSKI